MPPSPPAAPQMRGPLVPFGHYETQTEALEIAPVECVASGEVDPLGRDTGKGSWLDG
jgi:hypothetical protein